jgi:hypothetical protein
MKKVILIISILFCFASLVFEEALPDLSQQAMEGVQ